MIVYIVATMAFILYFIHSSYKNKPDYFISSILIETKCVNKRNTEVGVDQKVTKGMRLMGT